MTVARIAGWGTGLPVAVRQDDLWREFFAGRYADSRVARAAFAASGVTTRAAVVDPRAEDVSGWGTGARMVRYAAEAPALGKEAVAAALDEAGVDASAIGLFAVVSCTGYGTPGLDLALATDLGMSARVRRVVVGHMGCFAAVPGLAAVRDYVVANGRPAALLCLELCSLHLQPADDDVEQMVAAALFGDAAAAVVVTPEGGTDPPVPAPRGPRVVDVAALTAPDTASLMSWAVTDVGFRMGLSPHVPEVLGRHLDQALAGLLGPHGLTPGDIVGWAVHPGGRRIVDVVGRTLGLGRDRLAASYEVLDRHGNCSSATLMLVLERLSRGVPRAPGPVVALAFGPGLTVYSALLAWD